MKAFGKFLGFGCLGLVVIIAILAAIGASVEDKFSDKPALASAEAYSSKQGEVPVTLEAPNAPRASRWYYSQEVDEMRGQTAYFASIESENMVNFDFPYAGSQKMVIQLRKSPAFGKDVIFSIERGQITCDVYDCVGNISFDGKTEKLTLARSADGTTTVGFARYPDALARKMKSAKKVIVELTFYQEGTRQFVFETAGLEWPHF